MPKTGENFEAVYDVFEDHIFILMSVIAKRFSQSASNYFRKNYGIGVMEWRIACVLGRYGELGALEISEKTDMDKAAISRSLRVLEQMRWVEIIRTGSSTPRKLIRMTELGKAMQAEILKTSIRRQAAVLDGLDPARLDELRAALKYLMDRTRDVDAFYADPVHDA